MTAPTAPGSGMLMPSLDDLIESAHRSAGVTAVLDAADRIHAELHRPAVEVDG